MNKQVFVALSSVLVSSCVPYATTYPRIEVAGATYFRPGCGSTVNPASLVYYPFHGIYISVDVHTLRLGLHIPAGMVVQLNSKTIQVDGLMDTNPYMQTYEIRAASHASIGVNVYPRQFTELPDRYTRPDNFGPLEGAGDDGHLLWYLYTSENPQDSRLGALLPKGVSQGTIEIPSITINGQRYEPQKLTFKRESFVGVAAVNC